MMKGLTGRVQQMSNPDYKSKSGQTPGIFYTAGHQRDAHIHIAGLRSAHLISVFGVSVV